MEAITRGRRKARLEVNSSHLYGLPKYDLSINYSNLIQEFNTTLVSNKGRAQIEARSK